MSNPINTYYLGPLYFNPRSPLYIAVGPDGTLVSRAGPDTVYEEGVSAAVTLSNEGIILDLNGRYSNPAISLYGTVVNALATSLIFATYGSGVALNGGSLINYGTILAPSGNATGAYVYGLLQNTGTAARVEAGNIGVFLGSSTKSSLVNSGTITGGVVGVKIRGIGEVSNNGTASNIDGNVGIVGYSSFYDDAYSNLTISNRGTITGAIDGSETLARKAAGIYLFAGGLITNTGADAVISGYQYGIIDKASNASTGFAAAVLTVDNEGAIGSIGTSGEGIYLQCGGVINNVGTSAYIHGAAEGVDFSNFAGTVTNDGVIEAETYSGIYLGVGGTVINNGGAITGGNVGVYVYSQRATVTNIGGFIAGTKNDAVCLRGGGLIVNSGAGALLSGGENGVIVYGDAGTLLNGGDIYGKTQAGAYFQHGGTVTNADAGATIAGLTVGIEILIGSGDVTNEGTIESVDSIGHDGATIIGPDDTLDLSVGIILADGGTIDNQTGGLIAAPQGIGILIGGVSGEIINAGSITGFYAGILGYGTVNVINYGIIRVDPSFMPDGRETSSYAGSGIALIQGGTIANAGSISGFFYGIYLSGGGKVTNLQGATVSGDLIGIRVSGTAATVENEGDVNDGRASISESTFVLTAGIDLLEGGTVVNTTHASIFAYSGVGLELFDSSEVTNNVGGYISGDAGILSFGDAQITNGGTIRGTGDTFEAETGNTFDAAGIILVAGGTITNTGLIDGNDYTGSGFRGIDLLHGGVVTNSASTAVIAGNVAGIDSLGTLGTVINAGTIESETGAVTLDGTILLASGINLEAGGTILNKPTGLISATLGSGVLLKTPASVTNGGSIIGLFGGIIAQAAATITNAGLIHATGTSFINAPNMTLAAAGITLLKAGSITNTGTVISDNGDGIAAIAGGVIANTGVGALITGGQSGVALYAGGIVTNASTIAATEGVFTQQGTAALASGLLLVAGGTLNNEASGKVTAMLGAGVLARGAAVLTNTGTIAGLDAGIFDYGAANISNAGSITASGISFTANNTLLAASGIILLGGGTLNNAAGASITGLMDGVLLGNIPNAALTLDNAGVVIGTESTPVILAGETRAGIGIVLSGAGLITNESTGTIAGFEGGVLAQGSADGGISIDNSGLIQSTGTLFDFGTIALYPTGVNLSAGGTITNNAGGQITGIIAVYLSGGDDNIAAYLDNHGTIDGTISAVRLATAASLNNVGLIAGMQFGVQLEADGGKLVNQSDGSITGSTAVIAQGSSDASIYISNAGAILGGNLGIDADIGATVVNSGLIAGNSPGEIPAAGDTLSGTGIDLNAGGQVTNASNAIIRGAEFGVSLAQSGFLDNSGFIDATGTIFITAGHTQSAVGAIFAAGGTLTNEISGTIAGNIGAYLSDGGIVTNAGTISGTGGIALAFAGTARAGLEIDPGAVFNGLVEDISATGTLDLAAGPSPGTLSGLGSAFVGFPDITLATGASWTLTGTNAIAAGQTLSDFGTLTIDGKFTNDGLIVTDPSQIVFNGADTGTGTINIGANSDVVFNGSVSSTETIVFVGATGTLTIDDPAQFHGSIIGTGTIISSPACFAAGTRILSGAGQLTAVEDLQQGDMVELYDGTTADIIWIGNRRLAPERHPQPETVRPVLISAGALGQGLPWRDLIVSPDHALFIDNHLIPAKTLINGVTIFPLRRDSVTYYHIECAAHVILFAEGAPAESYLETGNRGAFDNGDTAIMLHPDFAQKLRETKSCAPFAETGPVVEAVRRRLLRLAAIETTADPAIRLQFEPHAAIIQSRSAIPGELTPDPRDRRRLGIKLAALKVNGRNIPLDHPALMVGWHDPEPDGRWTNGRAEIPASLLQGSKNISFSTAATLRYPLPTISRIRAAKPEQTS